MDEEHTQFRIDTHDGAPEGTILVGKDQITSCLGSEHTELKSIFASVVGRYNATKVVCGNPDLLPAQQVLLAGLLDHIHRQVRASLFVGREQCSQ